MKALIIYGPSGSGKTTLAKKYWKSWSHSEGSPGVLHLQRDDIRFDFLELGDYSTYRFNHKTEDIVDFYWKSSIYEALSNRYDLIISDTMCKLSDRNKIKLLLDFSGYDVEFIRMNTNLTTCIERDSSRGGFSVGEDVIKRQWEHFIKNNEDFTDE